MVRKLFRTFTFKARIVSTETGKDVELGEAGELLVRGPQVKVINVPDSIFTLLLLMKVTQA